MKVLVTGFKPFLGASTNPSEYLSKKLAEEIPQVNSLILPVEFQKSYELLKIHLEGAKYDRIIMLGQAAGRKKISLEKIALNWVQTKNQDETGHQPPMGPISQHSPLALMTKFPVDKVFSDLKSENFPIEISFSAGTFVCNDLYFRVLEYYEEITSVFVHVPLELDMQIEEQYSTLKKLINSLLSGQ